jgi:hypothetical protein
MRPDELSTLAAFDLLEMMFKSGVIARLISCAVLKWRSNPSLRSVLNQVSVLAAS